MFNIEMSSGKIYLYGISTKKTSVCPVCNTVSHRVHSKYYRKLKDLPILGHSLEIKLICKKFFCDNPCCLRKIFTERFSTFIKPYGRRTDRLSENLKYLAFTTSSNAMVDILDKISMSVSKNTLIRIIRNTDINVNSDYEYIGVDDFAFKKNNNYGTLICDLLSHKPIDLLPDRKSETLEKWLTTHPNVKVVSRDRSGAYAKGIRNANKKIVQIADRFHICHNLLERLKDFLKRIIPSKLVFECESQEIAPIEKTIEDKKYNTKVVDKEKTERHNRKKELIRKVKELHLEGHSQWEISRTTKLSRKTIRKYIQDDEDKIVNYTRPKKVSIIDEYKDYIKGCINENMSGTDVFEKIKDKGYTGSYGTLTNYIRKIKKENGATLDSNPTKHKTISRFNITNYVWKNNNELEKNQLDDLKLVFKNKPIIQKIYGYIQDFRAIFKDNDLDRFKNWINKAKESGIKELKSFCIGINKDFDAVKNSFAFEYNNGLLEGQINRLKMIKRQMYGRANFDLLKKRVLYLD